MSCDKINHSVANRADEALIEMCGTISHEQ